MNDRTPNESRASCWLVPSLLFLGTLLLVGGTSKDYGVTWDEPAYYYATDLHVKWIGDFGNNLTAGEIRKSIDDQDIKAHWHWNPYNVPHPPFSRIVSGIAKVLASPLLDKFSAYRLGPALFFAVLIVVMYLWMKELFGPAVGLFSTFAVMLTPNLFAYAHIAVTDLPLATIWFLTVYCFWKGLGSWRWSVALGIAWGLALSTKFPALLIPLPLILWAHLFYRDKYSNNIFSLLFLAPIVMVAIQPYLWHQTFLRILEFLYEGFSRGYRVDTNFGVFFFNRILSSNQLPWYYPFFEVGVTTPEPIVALALLGIASIIWLREQLSFVVLVFTNAVFILILGLLPGAVLHDGMRQMLSCLPFVAALAAVGFHIVQVGVLNAARRLPALRMISNLELKIVVAMISIVSVAPLLDIVFYHPFQLSYYNRFVGGIQGAYHRGLETTYFMEAITPRFLLALNENLPTNAAINASFANFMLSYYQKEGRLRRDIRITAQQPIDFYALLNRRSALTPRERNLMEAAVQPYIAVNIDSVPLVSVFDFRNPR